MRLQQCVRFARYARSLSIIIISKISMRVQQCVRFARYSRLLSIIVRAKRAPTLGYSIEISYYCRYVVCRMSEYVRRMSN